MAEYTERTGEDIFRDRLTRDNAPTTKPAYNAWIKVNSDSSGMVENQVDPPAIVESTGKSFKSRIIRDPLHDLIRVDTPEFMQVIHAPAFQRLRRIRQLGLAFLVYPGAEHSRFIHALGAYHLSLQMIDALKRQDPNLFSAEEEIAIPLAALCHDIGHGPFSHLFERVAKEFITENSENAMHEAWTRRIVEEDEAISAVLDKLGVKKVIVDIINHTYERLYVQDIVSSQLDVDRFDYLCRDSLMTGVKYGDLDLSWLLRTIKVATWKSDTEQKVLALDSRRGLSAVESYILGRHHMYKHVYYHKTIRSAETMLKNLLKEAVKASGDGRLSVAQKTTHPAFVSLAKQEIPSLSDYLSLNDFLIFDYMDVWAHMDLGAISDLSKRLVAREIFTTIVVPERLIKNLDQYASAREKSKEIVEKAGFDKDIYFIYDTPQDTAYKDLYYYQRKGEEEDAQDVFCVDGGKVFTLSSTKTWLAELGFAEHRIYVPKELEEQIRPLWH